MPHVLECLDELVKADKKLIVLSNSSARSATASKRLQRMGFTKLVDVLTSGELMFFNFSV